MEAKARTLPFAAAFTFANWPLIKILCSPLSFQPVMIAREGYPVETHTVITTDGYILVSVL